jgi:hypothetical protein
MFRLFYQAKNTLLLILLVMLVDAQMGVELDGPKVVTITL